MKKGASVSLKVANISLSAIFIVGLLPAPAAAGGGRVC